MSAVVWVRVDGAHIESVMSLTTSSFYGAWVHMNPTKRERLSEITAGVVSEFRTALAGNPQNTLDPDPQKIPQAFVRYAESLCLGSICQEMNHPMTEVEQMRVVRAEINLRYFYAGRMLISGAAVGGMPSYERRARRVRGVPRGLETGGLVCGRDV